MARELRRISGDGSGITHVVYARVVQHLDHRTGKIIHNDGRLDPDEPAHYTVEECVARLHQKRLAEDALPRGYVQLGSAPFYATNVWGDEVRWLHWENGAWVESTEIPDEWSLLRVEP